MKRCFHLISPLYVVPLFIFTGLLNHSDYMKRCVQLSEYGQGRVAPNPLVGAVIVHQNRIIGEGWHQQYGQPHAEVNAILNVKDPALLEASTLYVSLEPCCHHGKTPPCSDLIIKSGIPQVVIGIKDPFSLVNGEGISQLQEAGIKVIVGEMAKEVMHSNRRFLCFHQLKRPYIILKWAESSDGFIGRDGEQIRISNEETRLLVHKWRSEEAAIMAGYHTLVTDDPLLNVRQWPGKDPLRLTIDRDKTLPDHLHFFKETPSIAFTFKKEEEIGTCRYVTITNDESQLEQIMTFLYNEKVQSVLVEGGTGLINQFIRAGLWDEARVIRSPLTLKSGINAPVITIKPTDRTHIGTDELVTYYQV